MNEKLAFILVGIFVAFLCLGGNTFCQTKEQKTNKQKGMQVNKQVYMLKADTVKLPIQTKTLSPTVDTLIPTTTKTDSLKK